MTAKREGLWIPKSCETAARLRGHSMFDSNRYLVFWKKGLLSAKCVICGSKGLLMSNCARVWCCNVKSHMKTIHLDIDKTCFQCSSVSESWKSCSLKCVFRWCLFIAETSSSRRGAKTILIILTDHDSCTRLLIPLLSVRFLEVMVCQCWRKHSMLI